MIKSIMRVSQLSLVSVCAVALLVALPLVAHAEVETPPVQQVDLGPVLNVVTGLRDAFAQLPERIASAMWEHTGGLLLKALAAIIGFFVVMFRGLAGGALGDVNFFTQIPEPWVTLSALDGMRRRLVPVAVALGGLAGLLILVRWIAGLAFGWAFPGWAFALVKVAALVPLVGAAPAAMVGIIHAGNALSTALFDPAGGLPGLAGVDSAVDRLAAEGIAALVYFVVLVWLWWVRVQVVISALLLFVSSPLAVACWVLPFAMPQWVARTWITLFIGTVAVQVLQAATLGIGAGLLASNVVTGNVEGVGAGVVNLGLAAGMVMATCYVPRRVLGALVAHQPPGMGAIGTGLRVGLMLTGTGWLPGMAGAAAGVAQRAVVASSRRMPTPPRPPAPYSGGRVGSLLAGQQKLLPAPRD